MYLEALQRSKAALKAGKPPLSSRSTTPTHTTLLASESLQGVVAQADLIDKSNEQVMK
jgi:hypothetical protein